METLSPIGKVFHAGTLAGNPMATAAGLAALSVLTSDVYAEIERRSERLAALLGEGARSAGLPLSVSRVGTLTGIFMGDALSGRAPVDFDESKRTDEKLYARLFHAALAEGIAMAPGAYEALFVGLGHDDSVLDDLAERFARAAVVATR